MIFQALRKSDMFKYDTGASVFGAQIKSGDGVDPGRPVNPPPCFYNTLTGYELKDATIYMAIK